MTAQEWIDAAQKRADAATEGPWEHTGRNGVHTQVGACVALSHKHDDQQRWDDAEFIAAARTDLPKALDALRAVLEAIRPFPAIGPRTAAVEEWNANLRLTIAAALRTTP